MINILLIDDARQFSNNLVLCLKNRLNNEKIEVNFIIRENIQEFKSILNEWETYYGFHIVIVDLVLDESLFNYSVNSKQASLPGTGYDILSDLKENFYNQGLKKYKTKIVLCSSFSKNSVDKLLGKQELFNDVEFIDKNEPDFESGIFNIIKTISKSKSSRF